MERRDGLAPSDGSRDSQLVVTGYLSKDIPGLWPYVEHLVEDALRGGLGQETIEDVYDALTNRIQDPDGPQMQLWLAHEPAGPLLICITKIETWPSLKVCTIAYMAGSKLDSCLTPLHNTITAWAKSLDCDKILALVWRPGLERKLKGWAPGPRIMIRELK